MKATFFCASVLVLVPFAFLRELRPVESCSGRDGWGGGVELATGTFSFVSGTGRGGLTGLGVVVTEESVDDDGGSAIGGRGRAEISGRGL